MQQLNSKLNADFISSILMPGLAILDDKLWFPSVNESTEEGLLAAGGDLSDERLLLAYRNGIFPWFNDELPLWWCPDPRFVLFPHELKISKSMQQLLRSNHFEFRINTSFEKVIQNCRFIKRRQEHGTWITDEVERAYTSLHKKGYAVCAETWHNNELVGGLYGILIGRIFFGESMFSLVSNGSKFAFIHYINHLIKRDVRLIDCQVYTQHLESLGARMIPRNCFLELVKSYIY
jgi:leucyl/phenylalanyl-tRNA--protein transferase